MERKSCWQRVPEARWLVEGGINPVAAVRLARAGFTSREKLAAATREELFLIRGVSKTTVEECERLLGHPLPWLTRYWREKGLSPGLALTFCHAGIESLETLGGQSFKSLRALGVGVVNIRKCEKLLGRFFTDG
jgi:hypothetical protein